MRRIPAETLVMAAPEVHDLDDPNVPVSEVADCRVLRVPDSPSYLGSCFRTRARRSRSQRVALPRWELRYGSVGVGYVAFVPYIYYR